MPVKLFRNIRKLVNDVNPPNELGIVPLRLRPLMTMEITREALLHTTAPQLDCEPEHTVVVTGTPFEHAQLDM